MRTFTLRLRSATRGEDIAGVTRFNGRDASGSFGIRGGHARMMTALEFGLARLQVGEGPWQYLALPSALLYFIDDVLYLYTRRYLLDSSYERISEALERQLAAEERQLCEMKASLHRMEQAILRSLWELGARRGGGR